MKRQPNPVQLKALFDFAETNGAHWKSKLKTLWQSGSDIGHLRQLRNDFGPGWLTRFTLSK